MGIRSVIGFGLLLAVGCSVQRVPLRDPQAPPPADKTYDFEREAKPPAPPAVKAVPAQGIEAERPVLELPATADLGSSSVVVEDLGVDSATASQPPPGPESGREATQPRSGYRVQVFAGTDAEAAERVRRDLETRLGVQASVDREGSYYKVRAGNCVESQACRELQERLRDAGFASVWIVPAQVEP
jgi:cell division protein FtsN